MSINKNNHTSSSDPTEEDPLSARVVAIPKTEGSKEAESAPQGEPEMVVQKPEREPNSSPPKEVRVVLSEPRSAKQKAAESVGDILREARLRRGDDLYLIAEYLCIKPAFLIALENSRYDEFPADAYVIGFLRTYANFLGIDGKEAVDRYRYEMAGRRRKPVLTMPTPVPEGRVPSAIVLVGAVVALILIYSLWYNISSADRDKTRVPPPLPTAGHTTPDSNVAAGLTAPVPPSLTGSSEATRENPSKDTSMPSVVVIPPASPGIVVTAEKQPVKGGASEKATVNPGTEIKADEKAVKNGENEGDSKKPQVFGENETAARVVIRATQISWILVADESGKTLFDRILKPGESYKVPNKAGLSLTTNNGSGILLSLDGKDMKKMSKSTSRMVRNIDLDPKHLLEEFGASSR